MALRGGDVHVQLDQACIHMHELGVAQACPVLQAEWPRTIYQSRRFALPSDRHVLQ